MSAIQKYKAEAASLKAEVEALKKENHYLKAGLLSEISDDMENVISDSARQLSSKLFNLFPVSFIQDQVKIVSLIEQEMYRIYNLAKMGDDSQLKKIFAETKGESNES